MRTHTEIEESGVVIEGVTVRTINVQEEREREIHGDMLELFRRK